MGSPLTSSPLGGAGGGVVCWRVDRAWKDSTGDGKLEKSGLLRQPRRRNNEATDIFGAWQWWPPLMGGTPLEVFVATTLLCLCGGLTAALLLLLACELLSAPLLRGLVEPLMRATRTHLGWLVMARVLLVLLVVRFGKVELGRLNCRVVLYESEIVVHNPAGSKLFCQGHFKTRWDSEWNRRQTGRRRLCTDGVNFV